MTKNNKNNGTHRFDREHRERRKQSRQLFLDDVHINLSNSSFRNKLSAFSKLLLLLFIMIGIPLILFVLFRDSLLSKEYLAQLPAKLSEHRASAFIILVLLQMLQIVICFLPGQPIQFASSYLYGVGGGYLISILGATIGSIITYYLAKQLGHDSMHLLFGEKRVRDYIKKLNSRRAYTIIFLIYLIPGLPKDLVSYIAGLSNIRLKPFLLVSTLGRTPGLIESLLIGKFWAEKNYLGIAVVTLISLAILYLCIKNRVRIMERLAAYEDEDNETETR